MKWKKEEISVLQPSIMQIKCADCGCLPAECIESKSATQCPNCTWDEGCCWKTINKKK